ncbi:MAG: tandem-95 repeat protein [Planctomycetes bacterium]|nr:tandem-95 repeat protein [Planctomycetota bacterium]
MSRTFRQYIRMALFNKKKATAINKMEERLKAESKARAKAEERLRVEIETRAAMERKVKAEAEKMLLTQHNRYSVLAERVEAQAKEEIAKTKAQLKEALEKLNSYTAKQSKEEEKLNKIKEQLKTETAAKAKAQENLKAERQERRKVEAKAKEEIAKAKAQAQEEARSYAMALARAEEKLAEAKEQAKTETIATAKVEGPRAESKEGQSLDALTVETTKTPRRIHRYVFRPRIIKRIFALISALVILSAITFAVAIAVSVLNDTPVAEPGSAMTQEDKPVSIILTASDSKAEQLTYNVVTGPSHGSLNGTTPNIAYTPALNYNGPDSFTFSVNDGKADSDQGTISVTVLPVNDAPTAIPQFETTKVNKPLSTTLTGRDVDGDQLMFIICEEPEHGTLTFDSNFNTNGRLIYAPEPYFAGSDIFTFKLNDNELDSAPATVSVNVTLNLLPMAEPLSVTTTEDTPVEISLRGSDPDSDPLTYSVATGPYHGSLNGTAPNLTYTPRMNFNGLDSLTFEVNDGTADSALATVSIIVSPVNDPPVANDDILATREDTPAVAIDVLANDTDVDNEGRYLYLDAFSATAVTQGKNGSVTINSDGTLSYNPNPNFYGSDAFTYTISDYKDQTDTARVNVTVKMVNDAPAINSAPVTTATAGTLYTYDVNAIDPDLTDTLTYSLTTKPADMTINSATGLIQWKPAQAGENNVIVKVADSNSIPTTDTQSFTITVNPAPPKIAKLTPRDGYNQRNRKTLSADGKTELVRSSDDNRWAVNFGSYTSFDFPDVSIPADALVKSVVVFIEHFEEERFTSGKLEWAVGKGWPTKPVVWASIKAPINEEENHEAVDSWDITSLVDTRDKLDSLQLQVKNNDNVARKNTLIDYIYLVVEWD